MSYVFIGCPLHDGRLDHGAAQSLYATATESRKTIVTFCSSSLLSNNCNNLWCAALNSQRPIEWFAMLHGDIEPERWWVDKLIEQAELHGADVMGAVIPIKDERGLTSTALCGNNPWNKIRITQRQVRHEQFPDTFDGKSAAKALKNMPAELASDPGTNLLINTGCFVCRFNRPWAESVWFETSDTIQQKGALWVARTQSEDWWFSTLSSRGGAKVMATRTLKLVHKGSVAYPSHDEWGQATDSDIPFA